MALPLNVSYGTVIGQYIASVADGSDPDKDPDSVPLSGTVSFIASTPYVLDTTASPNPVTIAKTEIKCPLDSEGYLCSPYASTTSALSRGVMLVATDDPDVNPVGWNWTVIYNLRTPDGTKVSLPTHSIEVPTGATVDLTSAMPVPTSGGTFYTRGDKGDTGPANTLTIDTVTTGAPGSQAAAVIAGTAPNQMLSLTIPKGDTGATGATGPKGDPGNQSQTIDTLGAIAVKRTNLATNPSFETTSSTINVRTNLALNPAVSGGISSWGGVGSPGANLAYSTEQAHNGTTSFKTTMTATGTRGAKCTVSNPGFASGDTIVWSIWVYPSVTIDLQPYWERSTPTYTGGPGGATVNCPANTWTQITGSVTFTAAQADATGSFGFGFFSVGSWAINDFYYADEIIVERSPVLGPYFDGSTAAAGDYTYAWASTANASASYQKGTTLAGVATNAAAYRSTAWSNSRTSSLRITPVPITGTQTDTFASPGGDTGAMRLGMVAGRTYTASATGRLATAQTGSWSPSYARRIAIWYRAGGTYNSVPSTMAIPNTDGAVARITVTATIPANATEAFIRFYSGASTGNGDVWWDDFLLEESAYDGPYFDGSMPNAYWSGTADASTSVTAVLAKGQPDSTKVLRADGFWSLAPDATLLADGVDFNTLTTPGTYRFEGLVNSTNGPGLAQMYGFLVVSVAGPGRVIQTVYPGASGETGRSIYQRGLAGAVWYGWYRYASTRIDKTAGLAMYTWDQYAARDQITYGDTGVRDVSADLTNGFRGSLFLRRTDQTVNLFGVIQRPLGGSFNNAWYTVPTGFIVTSQAWVHIPARTVESGAIFTIYRQQNVLTCVNAPTTSDTDAIRLDLMWTTTQPWPTSLPGTASGTIPNA